MGSQLRLGITEKALNCSLAIATEQGLQDVIVGVEPTGHYWLSLAHYLRKRQVLCGVINPLQVMKSKEIDDNSSTKNDIKDAKVIAQLVKIFPRVSMPN
ncbi:Transposase [Paenibacillus sp. UNC496MF]|nr:Transposase [Paenibacillus sp. UNC496MF]